MTSPASIRRIPTFAAALGTLLIVLAACTTAASPSSAASPSEEASMAASESAAESAAESMAEGATVTITGSSSFGVEEITVPAGQMLMVVNQSSQPHTFTEGEDGGEAADPRVNEDIAVGATVHVTFPEPGDYNVTCLFHSSMNMVVHVE